MDAIDGALDGPLDGDTLGGNDRTTLGACDGCEEGISVDGLTVKETGVDDAVGCVVGCDDNNVGGLVINGNADEY